MERHHKFQFFYFQRNPKMDIGRGSDTSRLAGSICPWVFLGMPLGFQETAIFACSCRPPPSEKQVSFFNDRPCALFSFSLNFRIYFGGGGAKSIMTSSF